MACKPCLANPTKALREVTESVNLLGMESAEHPGCFYRVLSDGTVEWLNPPMEMGVEYRTTERVLGNPVYCRAFNLGACVVGTKEVKFSEFGMGMAQPYRLEAFISQGTKFYVVDNNLSAPYTRYVCVDASGFRIVCGNSSGVAAGSVKCIAFLWYLNKNVINDY